MHNLTVWSVPCSINVIKPVEPRGTKNKVNIRERRTLVFFLRSAPYDIIEGEVSLHGHILQQLHELQVLPSVLVTSDAGKRLRSSSLL